MKAITIYETVDGTRYDRIDDAINYELIYFKCQETNLILPALDKGKDSILHPIEKIEEFRNKCYDILTATLKPPFSDNIFYAEWSEQCRKRIRHVSHLYRIFGDGYEFKCVRKLFYRLECIDIQGREFPQAFYAIESNHKIKETL